MRTNQAQTATHPVEESESTVCGDIARERNRFFTGKFMAARDFNAEQHYHRSRHLMHNRILHGMGTVCGMRVCHHPNPNCDTWVVIRAGIAIDCCGREIVLDHDTALDLAEYLKASDPVQTAAAEPVSQTDEKTATADPEQSAVPKSEAHAGQATANLLVVGIRYCEEPVEFVPALYAEGTCDPLRHEANRIRETWQLEVHHWADLDRSCWPLTAGEPPCNYYDDCDETLPGPAGPCLEPDCRCGGLVPLALIQPASSIDEAGVNEAQRRFAIDMRGRPALHPAPAHLTHIVWHNWSHGGELTLNKLHNEMENRLTIHFDRPLKKYPEAEIGLGINPNTFIVQFYTGATETLEFLRFDPDAPPTLSDDGRTATFTIAPDLTYPKNRRGLHDGAIIYVTLRCDFILDCHDNPVDGDYLRAALPTGNGIPGGVFESWFRVVSGPEEVNQSEQQ